MTAWLTCSPSRCVIGVGIAYCDCAAVQSVAAILPDRRPKCRQLFPSGRCRWRPHAGVLNRARKGPVFFCLLARRGPVFFLFIAALSRFFVAPFSLPVLIALDTPI